jgi:hypothetical protein
LLSFGPEFLSIVAMAGCNDPIAYAIGRGSHTYRDRIRSRHVVKLLDDKPSSLDLTALLTLRCRWNASTVMTRTTS